jgi:hypothetical protein
VGDVGARSGGRAGAALWARREWRRRWRALVVLGLLAGMAGGVTLAAIAGARRTATVYDRWRTATDAPDAILFATQVGVEDQDYSAVLRLPEVVDGGVFTLAPVALKELPDVGALSPADTHLYRTLSKPLVRAGRLPDPTREDEILVNRTAAKRFHVHVGDHLTVRSASDPMAFYGLAPMTGGPTVRATVVGIGDSLMDQIFGVGEPGFIPSGAFLLRHGDRVPHPGNLVVRLRPGTDVNRFRARAAAAVGLPDMPVRDLGEDSKRVEHATDVERIGVLLFAAGVLLAGFVIVGQALNRTVYALAESTPPLRAVGLARRDVVGGMVRTFALPAALAGITATAAAVGLSSRFPVGLGGQLEPDRGVHADWLVLVPGALLVLVAVVAGVFAASMRATSAAVRERDAAAPSPLLRPLQALRSLSLSVGASMALERGRGERSLPIRPALAGAAVGILGVVGSFGLVHGIDDAHRRPERSGQRWSATMYPDEQHPVAAATRAALAEREVDLVTVIRRVPQPVGGAALPVYTAATLRGQGGFAVLHGRAPVADDEVAIGPSTATALHRGIGSTIAVGSPSRTFRVVGEALLPQTPHSSFDQGAWLTGPGLRRLGAAAGAHDIEIGVHVRGGAAAEAVLGRLGRSGIEIDPVALPQDVLLLRNVRGLPQALGAFLALLGVAAVGHALVTASRRRRHDLAVLRVLGVRRRQCAAAIAWQAVGVAALALAIGLPLGVAAGRLTWRWIADATPLLYVGPVALVAVLLAVPVTLAVANALAVVPAWRASRVRPATVLRTE